MRAFQSRNSYVTPRAKRGLAWRQALDEERIAPERGHPCSHGHKPFAGWLEREMQAQRVVQQAHFFW